MNHAKSTGYVNGFDQIDNESLSEENGEVYARYYLIIMHSCLGRPIWKNLKKSNISIMPKL